jgi:Flp pilus assembly protein TadB
LNPLFIPILTAILGVIVFYWRRWAKEQPLRRFEQWAGEKPQKTWTKDSVWEQLGITWKNKSKIPVGWTIGGALVGAWVAGVFLHTSISFGLVFGGMAPFATLQIIHALRAKQERADAKAALELAQAVFAAGGTVEDWIRQVPERMEGPLRDVFRLAGAEAQRLGTPEALAMIARKTTDSFFRSAIIGMRANYDSAGDLQKFLSGVMEDIIQGERLERRMKGERERFQKMMAAILAVPAFLYIVFGDDVRSVLQKHFEANVALFVGLVGYLVIFWMAYRASRPRTF